MSCIITLVLTGEERGGEGRRGEGRGGEGRGEKRGEGRRGGKGDNRERGRGEGLVRYHTFSCLGEICFKYFDILTACLYHIKKTKQNDKMIKSIRLIRLIR